MSNTNINEEIQKAIGAHGMWKQRLRTAIDTGKSDASAAVVTQDNQCIFGKWFYSLDQSIKATPRWQAIKADHADFHKEAARILQLALTGKKQEAEDGISPSSKFAALSAKLTVEMMAWKKESA